MYKFGEEDFCEAVFVGVKICRSRSKVSSQKYNVVVNHVGNWLTLIIKYNVSSMGQLMAK